MKETGNFCIKSITKVEGHANLSVELRDGKVEKCEFQVYEGQRFFEQLVVGRHYSQIPLIVSRICGFCNTSHLNTAIEAVERAFSVKPSEQTLLLRELATNAEFIKSHALHLMFLVLPDFLGRESIMAFKKAEQKYIKQALALKKIGTDLSRALGGRVYPTVSIRVGGFSMLPRQSELQKVLTELKDARKTALEMLALFNSFRERFAFERKTEYVGLVGSQYCLLCGQIHCSDGTVIEEQGYLNHVKEFVVPYSNARIASFNSKEYKVGAQARLNLNHKELYPAVKEKVKALNIKFPNHSIYFNNIAQAIELLQCIESSIE
ncbi:MAG: nickel-dependent hydrogenase large subunit, partial [Candidatus Diapherotrites archaeon]|nr:nickel-dependent hydrogenase large subunit [Candidatus Diapherotrites archaeon]